MRGVAAVFCGKIVPGRLVLGSAPRPKCSRVVLVVNPYARGNAWEGVGRYLEQELSAQADVCVRLHTTGESGDAERIATSIREYAADVVVAAGGDGTVSQVVSGILNGRSASVPLAIIPLGTANNVARSLGLDGCRRGHRATLDLTVRTALYGQTRSIDLGQVGSRYFVGSVAIGMDADILFTRNRWRDRLRLSGGLAGYGLYLSSCAVNLLRPHGAPARLDIKSGCGDPAGGHAYVYNLLITNTPIYAGEFRFAGDDPCDDGCLDLFSFAGPLDYLGGYVPAWPRHLRWQLGRTVHSDRRLQRVRELVLDLEHPVPYQIDGECGGWARSYAIRALPAALSVRVPSQGINGVVKAGP